MQAAVAVTIDPCNTQPHETCTIVAIYMHYIYVGTIHYCASATRRLHAGLIYQVQWGQVMTVIQPAKQSGTIQSMLLWPACCVV